MQRTFHSRRPHFEHLEGRELLSITVDTLVDENDGVGFGTGTSLREAIAAAAAGDTIDFSVTGTIQLAPTLAPLLINKNLTINGPGADLLTVRAYDPTPTQKNGDGRTVIAITNANPSTLIDVTLHGLTITGGDSKSGAGGIDTQENLLLTDCAVIDNAVDMLGFEAGGGIFSYSGANSPANYLTVRDSTIAGNLNINGEGGGIRKRFGILLIEDSTINSNEARTAGGGISASDGGVQVIINRSSLDNNEQLFVSSNTFYGGGALFALGANVSITSSQLNGNSANYGAAVFIRNSGTPFALSDSIVSDNTARYSGGGLYLSGISTISRTTIDGNTATASGGGIFKNGLNMQLTDSAVIGNSAATGGGVLTNTSTAPRSLIRNSTISGNTATVTGAGVQGGFLEIRSSTIVRNTAPPTKAGGVYATGSTFISHSIVSENVGDDVVGGININSSGYNIVGTGNAIGGFTAAGNDRVGVSAMLGPLQNNGGPTVTHALQPDSPAIDTGNPAAVAGVSGIPIFDQRGMPYRRVFDGNANGQSRIDIGAYEYITPAALPKLFGDYSNDGRTDAADYILWRKLNGTTGIPSYSTADGTGDGQVTTADYDQWKSGFGWTADEDLPLGGGQLAAEVSDANASTRDSPQDFYAFEDDQQARSIKNKPAQSLALASQLSGSLMLDASLLSLLAEASIRRREQITETGLDDLADKPSPNSKIDVPAYADRPWCDLNWLWHD